MIKRAHLYTCSLPLPETAKDDSNSADEFVYESLEDSMKNNKKSILNEEFVLNSKYKNQCEEFIEYAAPKSSALKCKCCPGKLILNFKDIDKHLSSKKHKNRAKTYRTNERAVKRAKLDLAKRIELIESDV